MRKLFSIPEEKETRLWNKYMSNTFEPLNKPDSTIQDAGLYQGQVKRPHCSHPQRPGWSPLMGLAIAKSIGWIAVEQREPNPDKQTEVLSWLTVRWAFPPWASQLMLGLSFIHTVAFWPGAPIFNILTEKNNNKIKKTVGWTVLSNVSKYSYCDLQAPKRL